MPFVTSTSRLSEIIIADTSLIPVLNRFGITLGVGDATVADACRAHGDIEPEFLVSILNTYLSNDYFPEQTLKGFQATTIIKYLRETYAYYTRFTLANIERHFNALVGASGGDNNLGPMRKFFDTVKAAFVRLKDEDEKVTFPGLATLDAEALAAAGAATAPVEEYLTDMAAMLIVHLRGSVDSNLCYAVIAATTALAADFSKNSRIRNRILLNASN